MTEAALGRPAAVLLDAGGVLIAPDPAMIGPALEPFVPGATAGGMLRAHYAGMAAQDCAGLEDWDAYALGFVRCLGSSHSAEAAAAAAFLRIFSAWIWRYPYPEGVKALWLLHQRGARLGVVSNAEGQVEGVLRNLCICQVGRGGGVPVEVVVDSKVVGVSKPDPAIFDHALGAMGVDPGDLVYVGDSIRNDVEGALAAGITPLLLDPHDDRPSAPCRRVRSLLELV